MSSAPTVSLFSAQPDLDNRPYSFLFSLGVHGAVIVLIFLGIFSAPKIKTPIFAERYAIRHLDLQSLYPEVQRAAASAIHEPPRPHPKAPELPKGGTTEEQQPIMRQVLDAPKVQHTLVQPDIPKPLKIPVNTPLPTVVVWNSERIKVDTVTAPTPQRPAVTLAKPVIQRSNQSQRLADIAIRPTDMRLNSPILPSTTSPIVVSGPKPTPPAPLTTAATSGQQASGQVMSLSDTQMANGHVALPPVNQSASTNSAGALAPGKGTEPSHLGHGNPNGAAGGGGAGSGGGGNTGEGTTNGQGIGSRPATTTITRQKEGQFGAVIVGSKMEERYPEIADLWNGRMAYTVFLPVGLAKNWVLQYSLSRAENSSSGSAGHIEAPWPFSIVRPNLEPGAIDADALMIHGFVNQAGRFEALTVAFPPEFAQKQFILGALAQWQFRPATQNGQNVKVEVLLIIPEEAE
ncbi:MAG: hypothetical protein ABSB60_13515 [Terracidiphilus sp.]|jgi:hypothetical protein